MAWTNTLAFYTTDLVMPVKGFMIQATGGNAWRYSTQADSGLSYKAERLLTIKRTSLFCRSVSDEERKNVL